jgi:UDP-3-O-[3-hydroxymyristoyl] glucosamine N-acyltransferase
MNPLDSQGPTERTIVVNNKTQITMRVPTPYAEFSAAMKLFQENTKTGKHATMPAPFTDKTATINDIKIGMTVTVTAAENIKDAATVNATQIIFQAVPSAPTPVPKPATK